MHKGRWLELSYHGKMSIFSATPNHLFLEKDVGWIRLDQLKQGQVIKTENPDNLALVFMVNPLRKTTLPDVVASFHVSNAFNAFGIFYADVSFDDPDYFEYFAHVDESEYSYDDTEYFDFFEYKETGSGEVLESDVSSPCTINDQEIHVLPDVFCQTVYNFEVADCHTYFITKQGLWVHDSYCVESD